MKINTSINNISVNSTVLFLCCVLFATMANMIDWLLTLEDKTNRIHDFMFTSIQRLNDWICFGFVKFFVCYKLFSIKSFFQFPKSVFCDYLYGEFDLYGLYCAYVPTMDTELPVSYPLFSKQYGKWMYVLVKHLLLDAVTVAQIPSLRSNGCSSMMSNSLDAVLVRKLMHIVDQYRWMLDAIHRLNWSVVQKSGSAASCDQQMGCAAVTSRFDLAADDAV